MSMPELIPEYQGCPSKGLTKSQDDNKHAEDFFFYWKEFTQN